MTAADVRLLFEYNAWANRLLMNAASRLSAEQFVHDMGASFGSVRSTLLHIVIGEWRWLQFWLEQPFDHDWPPANHPSVAAVESFHAEVAEKQRAFVYALTDGDLQRSRLVRGRERPLVHTVYHVLQHSAYHRGQVVTLLRQLGHEPPTTDFLAFPDSA